MPAAQKTGRFGTTPAGEPIDKYQLDAGPCSMEVITLGGIVTRLRVPDRAGLAGDVLLRVCDVATVFHKDWPYLNSLVGRVANRITGASFTLDGKTYTLARNNNDRNCLHGGNIGYDRRVWTATPVEAPDGAAIKLSLIDPDGTEGFPGTVRVEVVYTLTTQGVWRIEYQATTDQPTPVNLTHHAYFNLKDAGRSSVNDHELRLPSSRYTPNDEWCAATGEIAPVENTPMDFRTVKRIGRDLDRLTNTPIGYDVNFPIDNADGTLRLCAEVFEPTTGRTMTVHTTEPAVQLYTGGFLDGTFGDDAIRFQQHTGFCLETQRYPNAVNRPNFPDTILRPGQTYRHTTEYRFGVR